MTDKICKDCKKLKPLDEFSKNGMQRGKQAYKARCKPCYVIFKTEERIQREATDPRVAERRRELAKAGTVRDPNYSVKQMLRGAKYRSRAKGLYFDLVPEDIIIPAICPILGIPLYRQAESGRGPRSHNVPSIDRIDNTMGYTKSNIQIISWRANLLKRDYSFKDIEKIYLHLLSGRTSNRAASFEEIERLYLSMKDS